MNILFIADVSISKVIGGAERVLFEQSSRLANRGHNVHILTRKLTGHKHSYEVVRGVKEWRYNVNQPRNAVSFFINTWRNGRRLFESLQTRFKFDCLNIHQPFSAVGALQSPLSKTINKVYTSHSLSFEEYISRNAKPQKFIGKNLYFLNILIRKWLEKRILKMSDDIVTLSQFAQDKLSEAHQVSMQKITVIPGGVDSDRFKPSNDKMAIRQRFNIPAEKTILLSVRNLVQRMGIENLIVALKDVVRTAPNIFLVVGGDGPLKDDLISLAKILGVEKYIRFVGFIPEEELVEHYQMADIFVLPTRELEGFGLVTLEAMACGVPVLGTPIGGTNEILGKFDSNLLFENTSPDAMAKLIMEKYRLINDSPEEWDDISKRCRNFVEESYSWEKNVESLEEIFMGTREDVRDMRKI